MIYVALAVGAFIGFFVYCIILKISARIAGIRHISIMQCLLIFIIPLALVKTLNLVLSKTIDDEFIYEMLTLSSYCIIEISTIYWTLYGITILRSIAFFIVSKIVTVILGIVFISFIYTSNINNMKGWINDNFLTDTSNEQTQGGEL